MNLASSTSQMRESWLHQRLRRLLARIPARWRGAVLLGAFTVFFPIWVTTVVWEAVKADDSATSREIEEA